jgi:hypothetical protein
MRSEAIEQLSVGKGAPTCRGFFSFSKDQGQYFKTASISKNEKIFLYEASADRVHITEIIWLFFLPLSVREMNSPKQTS